MIIIFGHKNQSISGFKGLFKPFINSFDFIERKK